MAQYALSLGMPWILAQNVEYALPARACFVTSSVAIETSVNGVAWSALTGANTTGAWTSAVYVRCTAGQPTIVCKA